VRGNPEGHKRVCSQRDDVTLISGANWIFFFDRSEFRLYGFSVSQRRRHET